MDPSERSYIDLISCKKFPNNFSLEPRTFLYSTSQKCDSKLAALVPTFLCEKMINMEFLNVMSVEFYIFYGNDVNNCK